MTTDVADRGGGEGPRGQGSIPCAGAGADTGEERRAHPMARALEEKAGTIVEANRADLDRARRQGYPRAFVDRLTLTDSRIEEMAAGVRQVAALPDPVGETVEVGGAPTGSRSPACACRWA